MKRKKLLALCLVAAMSASTLAGCGNSGGDSKEASGSAPESSAEESKEESSAESEESGEEGGPPSDVVAFEDIQFPDAMPSNPTMAEEDWYAYDDMSVHYDLEFFTYNYGEDLPSTDPIAAWLGEKFNVTLTLTTATSGDVESVLSSSS